MMYMIFIIDHIHHLMNEFKMQSFAYNSDQRVYILVNQHILYGDPLCRPFGVHNL
jgi:hypothetical protein